MKNKPSSKKLEPMELPQSEVFQKREVYQHPQPADTGLPLETRDADQVKTAVNQHKQADKTSKEEGLNEKNSKGGAGAFEGFEDQGS